MFWQKYFHFPEVICCLQVQLLFYIYEILSVSIKGNNIFKNSRVDICFVLFFITQNIDEIKTSATVPKFTSLKGPFLHSHEFI